MDKDDPLVRKNVSLRRSVWDEIEAYRAAERLASEAEAVRRLIADQLKAYGVSRAALYKAFARHGLEGKLR